VIFQTPLHEIKTPKEKNERAFRKIQTAKEKNEELEMEDLFAALKQWRRQQAEEEGLPVYCILSQKAIEGITKSHPQTQEELLSIKGIGKRPMETIALSMASKFCRAMMFFNFFTFRRDSSCCGLPVIVSVCSSLSSLQETKNNAVAIAAKIKIFFILK